MPGAEPEVRKMKKGSGKPDPLSCCFDATVIFRRSSNWKSYRLQTTCKSLSMCLTSATDRTSS